MPTGMEEEDPCEVDPSNWDDLIAPKEEGMPPSIRAMQYNVPPVDLLDEGVNSAKLTAKSTDVRPVCDTLIELTTGVTTVTVGGAVGDAEGALTVITE